MTTEISPNAQQSTATESPAVPSLDSIAQKMAAMRESTLRNQIRATEQTATGQDTEAEEVSSPVAPSNNADAEVADSGDTSIESDNLEAAAPEEVSPDSTNSTEDELIDFIEFAEENPNAKFKFMRNGKEVVVDAKKQENLKFKKLNLMNT